MSIVQTQRKVLRAAALGSLVASAGIPSADHASDSALLAACSQFEEAHATQKAANVASNMDDDDFNLIATRWYASLDTVLEAPLPTTDAGRVALARCARLAFVDHVTSCQTDNIEDVASPEQLLTFKALRVLSGDVS